jgi:tRNA A-37 threonylcarbamoyl transferase component Bud32
MPEVLKRVGRFDLLEVIGRGGAAVVYLALQRDLQRNVALKELAPFHLADTSFAERFVEESRLAGSMNHANVVTVHEYFEDGSVPYIAMEYLPNGSLRQYIGRLSTAQIAGVLEGVLAGLAHGEAYGIVHRDLKPENLLVALDGRVKIADFGVARAYSKAATRAVVTVAGTTIGTPAYMSPEQALGSDLTPATDLYSLGVVAWELLTGQVPFEENDTPVAVLYRHVHEQIPSVRSVAPDVDEGIERWLERMLAKRPEDRFQSADEAWVELEDVVLELLGPRWRRAARLPVGDPTPPSQRTLTPARFGPAGTPTPAADTPATKTPAADAPATDTPATDTVTGDAAAAVQPTIAPTRRRPRSNTTMLRIARRHRDSGDQADADAPDIVRRRLIALAIVAAMAVAAVAGIVLAGSSNRQPGPSKAAQRAAAATEAAAAGARTRARAKAAAVTAADQQLVTIVHHLAVTRNRALTRVLNDKTPSDQTRDAATAEKAYVAAAGKAAELAARSPAAKPLSSTLKTTAGAYAQAVAAGRVNSQRGWSRAWKSILADEQRLRLQVAKL